MQKTKNNTILIFTCGKTLPSDNKNHAIKLNKCKKLIIMTSGELTEDRPVTSGDPAQKSTST